MNLKFCTSIFLFVALVTTQGVNAQSKISLTPGLFYNGGGFSEEVFGLGAILGLEYRQEPDHFFSVELRTRYGYYAFDDGTKPQTGKEGELIPPKNDKARLEYSLFSPQVGLVPKFYLGLDDNIFLFVENEFSMELISGHFKYYGQPQSNRHFTAPVFSYVIALGIELQQGN